MAVKKARSASKAPRPKKKKKVPRADAWEKFVADALRSIASSLQWVHMHLGEQTAMSKESHAVFMADAKMRVEQHAMMLESERLTRERLVEVRRLEAEVFEQNKSAVAREQASLAAVREMNSTVKKALTPPGSEP